MSNETNYEVTEVVIEEITIEAVVESLNQSDIDEFMGHPAYLNNRGRLIVLESDYVSA